MRIATDRVASARLRLASSLRVQLNAHVANPVCGACHNLMDPIGFGLEHFDAVGAWRDLDGTAAIDATGVLPDHTAFDGAVQLASALKRQTTAVTGCVTQKMFAYSLGRDREMADRCHIDQLNSSFTAVATAFGVSSCR